MACSIRHMISIAALSVLVLGAVRAVASAAIASKRLTAENLTSSGACHSLWTMMELDSGNSLCQGENQTLVTQVNGHSVVFSCHATCPVGHWQRQCVPPTQQPTRSPTRSASGTTVVLVCSWHKAPVSRDMPPCRNCTRKLTHVSIPWSKEYLRGFVL